MSEGRSNSHTCTRKCCLALTPSKIAFVAGINGEEVVGKEKNALSLFSVYVPIHAG